MRRETAAERAAWTAHIEGAAPRPNKYRNERCGKYASKREAKVAGDLALLQAAGYIRELREQVPFTLVEGQGRIRPIRYVADFTYLDADGQLRVLDAKGYAKDKVYRLKKKLMKLLLNIEIEEV